jgi:hypothetical protein
MSCTWKYGQWVWLTLGLLGGLVLAGLWPDTPLHAVATDRTDTFAMATGPLDEEIEAVYFLDFYTGDLTAAVLSRQTGKFNAFFTYNVNADLAVDPAKNPKYLMVTGVADMRRAYTGRLAPSRSVIYVAEITTGKIAAFGIPWSSALHAANQPMAGKMICLDRTAFRRVAASGSPAPIGGGTGAIKGKGATL